MNGHGTKTGSDEIMADLDLLKLGLPAQNVPEHIYERTYRADEQALSRLSQVLGPGTLTRVNINYEITAMGKKSFKMISDIQAEIHQNCVISLEPLVNQINDQAVTVFMPRKRFDEIIKLDEEDILSDDNLEPIDGPVIELGRVLYEQLAGAIDHYPKAPGATLDDVPGRNNSDAPPDEGPFAVLAQRKKDQ